MIPTSYQLRSYEQVPDISDQKIQQLISQGEQLVVYDELVISLKGFNHPGNSQILQPYINNLKTNIKEQFEKYQHSEYARLIISLRTVGKLKLSENSQGYCQNQNSQGKQLFEKVKRSSLFKLHQNTIHKIDFSKPIWNQIDQLKIEQKQVLIQVPTLVQTQQKVLFKETPWEELQYTNSFWLSTIIFQTFIFATLGYFLNQWKNGESLIHCIPFFLFGMLKWTLLEYYFHRFRLHYSLTKKGTIGNHLMHHMFPQLKNKLALSIKEVMAYTIGFWLIYSRFLQTNQTIALLLGILVGLTLYDISHYYIHFGPQTTIAWINNLKRNHLKHHYRNSDKGFGVSTTLWDKIFNTQHEKQISKKI